MKMLLILVLFPILTCIAESEEPFWEYIGGPPTGNVYDMAINSKGEIFVTAKSGVFRSTDKGESWKNLLNYYAESSYSLTITSDNTVFAIANDSDFKNFSAWDGFYLHKSTDNGNTWQIIHGPWQNQNDNFNYRYVPTCIRSDKDDNIYVVAAQHRDSAKIFLSSDKGESWFEQSEITDLSNKESIRLFTDSKGRIALSCGTYESTYGANYSFKISLDSGKTWKNKYINLLFNDICFLSKDTMLVTLYKYPDIDYGYGLTTDGGETFNYDNNFFMPQRILRPNSQEIFVTSTWGLYYSSNNGKTWRHNLINDFDSLKKDIWEKKWNPNPNSIYKLVQDKEGKLYASSYDRGIYLSYDKGKNWQRSNKGFSSGGYSDMCFDRKGNLYVSGWGLFRSPDKGKTWETLGFLSEGISTINVTNDGIIYAGGGNRSGLYRSFNNGITWDTLMRIWDNSAPSLKTSLIGKSGILYYEDGFDGFYISTDKGDSWIERKQPGEAVIVENSEGHIFVGEEKWQNIWRTTNDGIAWDSVIYNIQNFSGNNVLLIFKPDSTIGYALNTFWDTTEYYNRTTLWKTTDNGRTWLDIPEGIDWQREPGFNKFVLDSAGNIWDGCSLFNEKDYKWQINDSGYHNIMFQDEEVSPDGYLFIMDLWGGIYKSRDRFVSAEDRTQPTELSLSNYPNPFENETEIEYSLPSPVSVRIAVYDIFGREIEVIENEYKDAGRHRAKFNSERLTSGVYFVKVQTGSNTITKPVIKK